MARKQKPEKPYEGFPLFAHACGQWAKKIRGRMHYFGVWADPDAALNEYLDQRDDLQAGRTPRIRTGGLTVKELCNEFLTSKKRLLDSGELSPRTFNDYHTSCLGVASGFGKDRPVSDLLPADFEWIRSELAKTRGPVALGNEIQRIRTVFRYAHDHGLVQDPVRFGAHFRKPSRKVIRNARHAAGSRMFEADELRRILDAATEPIRTMVLLGINCGFGQSDVSNLTAGSVSGPWIQFPRPKTGVPRRCPLWPETAESLDRILKTRHSPMDRADSELVFLTRFGRRWVRTNRSGTPDDEIGKAFAKLLKAMGIKRRGLSFYGLRHTFETIGGESKDQVAVDAIMGHADPSMAAHYRQRISDERLLAVTDTVRRWLWPPKRKRAK